MSSHGSLAVRPFGVDRRAGVCEQSGERGRVVGDADFGQHAQGLFVDELLVGVGEIL